MKLITKIITVASIVLLPSLTFARDLNRDLTGVWLSSGTGTAQGTYYIRVFGTDVFWVGQSSDHGKSWTNTFQGTFHDNQIEGRWADVPLGTNRGDRKT